MKPVASEKNRHIRSSIRKKGAANEQKEHEQHSRQAALCARRTDEDAMRDARQRGKRIIAQAAPSLRQRQTIFETAKVQRDGLHTPGTAAARRRACSKRNSITGLCQWQPTTKRWEEKVMTKGRTKSGWRNLGKGQT